MRSKKSSSADLNKKSTFYLAIGLFLVLLISWRAIEWKNYDDDRYGYIALDVDEDDDEEIPITEQLKHHHHHRHHLHLKLLKLLKMKKKLRKL